MSITVAVVGATGKMGRMAVESIKAAEDMSVISELSSTSELSEIGDATHVLDLTVPDISAKVAEYALSKGKHLVIGTSGWSEHKRAQLNVPEGLGVLIAPNFSVGSVLATKFAAQAAPYFESVEIVEMHHPDKVDAPSGTAVRTAEDIAKARQASGVAPSPDATVHDGGARGADINGVRVHAVRLRGLEAHQEVLLGSPGQQLVLRHDAFDRAAYMPGVLLGLRTVASRPGLTYGLDKYMDL